MKFLCKVCSYVCIVFRLISFAYRFVNVNSVFNVFECMFIDVFLWNVIMIILNLFLVCDFNLLLLLFIFFIFVASFFVKFNVLVRVVANVFFCCLFVVFMNVIMFVCWLNIVFGIFRCVMFFFVIDLYCFYVIVC